MQYRKLGWTDLELSTVGLGTWAHGGGGWRFSWGAQDDADSIATVEAALELGINWIDCAAVYGLGHAEEVLGQALKKLHAAGKKPIVATKCSRVPVGNGDIRSDLSRASVRKECEDSLCRLGVDVIDLYQIHWPNPEEQIEEGWSTVAELVKEGKVRYAGVSNFNVSHLQRVQPIHPVASLQPPYSMLVRGVETETLAYCAANRIGVVAYSPMQKGLLTGKVTPEWVASLPADDHRHHDARFQEPQLSATVDLVNSLRGIAEKNSLTLSQLAVAWVLRRPEVTAAIVGARRPTQLQETAAAGDAVLPAGDVDAIEALLAEHTRRIS
jgi:aryl-alcohol dehydrogenase-like predicted oxidoreductase